MIEPIKSLNCEFSNSCDKSTSDGLHLITQDKIITNTPQSIICEETIHVQFNEPAISRELNPQIKTCLQNDNLIRKSSSENYIEQKLKESRCNTKDSCSNFIKNENLPCGRSQTNNRSLSAEDCVEVQEYFQEEEIEEDDEKNESYSLFEELEQGSRILDDILSDTYKNINWPFIDAIDSSQDGCQDYYKRVQHPMWLSKMKGKFSNGEYLEMADFVADMRLMIDNCILFNGSDHSISKKAKKLETIINQKVTLLPRDLRDKINEVVPPRNNLVATDTFEKIQKISKRGKDSRRRMRELQKQRMFERKLMQDKFVSTLQTWDENLFDEVSQPQMKATWELPQLGLFLFVCSRPLNLNISQYELERCFVLSRQSSSMQRLMTSLLSSANQRSKLHLNGYVMPNNLWEDKLKEHISIWFKSLSDSNYDVAGVCEKLSIDEMFFKIMGYSNPLAVKSYHDLTYFQKIWVVKSICDHLLNIQKSLLDAIEKQDMLDLRPRELGIDNKGNTYFYFSQFCGDDVRIYKQSPLPTVEIGPIEFNYEDDVSYRPKKRTKRQAKKRPTKVRVVEAPEDSLTPRTRDSRLRQNLGQQMTYKVDESNSSSSESESETENEKVVENTPKIQRKSTRADVSKNENILKVDNKESAKSTRSRNTAKKNPVTSDGKSSANLTSDHMEDVESSWICTSGSIPRRSERKIIEESIKNAVTPDGKSKSSTPSETSEKSSKKNKNNWKDLAPFLPERNLRSRKSLLDVKQVEIPSAPASKKTRNGKKVKKEEEEYVDETNMETEDDDSHLKSNELSSIPSYATSLASTEATEMKNDETSEKADDDSVAEFDVKKEDDMNKECDVEDEDKTEEMMEADAEEETCINFEPSVFGPNLEEFEMVAESIEDIRNLIENIKNNDGDESLLNVSNNSKTGNKKNPEKLLLENLDLLLKDLEPHEAKLTQALKKARMQLRKEEESYKEIPDLDEEPTDGTETSLKDASSPSEHQAGKVNDFEAKRDANSPSVKPEVKKKNIFEDDIDMALLLTEGRVLRRRNNMHTQPPVPLAVTRSRRLLNKPSRYKYDDYLTDDSILATACSDDVVSKKSEESRSSMLSTPLPFISESAEIPIGETSENKAIVRKHSVSSFVNQLNSLSASSIVRDSKSSSLKINNLIYSTGLKTSAIQTFSASQRGMAQQSLPPRDISLIEATKMTDQTLRPPFLQMAAATNLQSPNQNHVKVTPNSNLSSLMNQKPFTQLNFLPTSLNPTKVVGSPHSNISVVNLQQNNQGTPGLILIPKSLNFSQSSLQRTNVIPQSFLSSAQILNATPTGIGNRPIQLGPATSNVVINFQNVLPISNANINISNQIVRSQNNPLVAVGPSSTKPISITPKVLIPFKTQGSGNLTPLHSVQLSQSTPKVGNLIPILNSAGTSSNINRIPVQLNCENGQSILFLPNTFAQVAQQNPANPIQLSASIPANFDVRSRLGSAEGQNKQINEAIVRQLVLNNPNVAHQLIGSGLVPVSHSPVNNIIQCPPTNLTVNNGVSVNIPTMLNKDLFKVLSQPQKPIQLNQVTSQSQ